MYCIGSADPNLLPLSAMNLTVRLLYTLL